MKNTTKHYILIADAHLNGGQMETEFFQFLNVISAAPEEYGIVFLGDIFELWIALPGYESDAHHRFCDWCRIEKQKRTVLFVEGNHEFYISLTQKQNFTEVSDSSIGDRNVIFMHGDRINRADWKYALLRTGIRNVITRSLLRLIAPLFGPALADHVRLSLKTTNMIHKKYFPEQFADQFLRRTVRNTPYHTVLMGHFHQRKQVRLDDGIATLEVIPAFADCGEAAVLDMDTGNLNIRSWQQLTIPALGLTNAPFEGQKEKEQ